MNIDGIDDNKLKQWLGAKKIKKSNDDIIIIFYDFEKDCYDFVLNNYECKMSDNMRLTMSSKEFDSLLNFYECSLDDYETSLIVL